MAKSLLAVVISVCCLQPVTSKMASHVPSDHIASTPATCYEKGGFTQSEWPHCFKASDSILAYSSRQGISQIRLGMWAEGHIGGWSALAFAGNGGMKGARQIVVRKNDAGVWIAEDRYSSAYETPSLSVSQDIQLLSASEVDGGTAWTALLPMDSCKGYVDGYPSNYPLRDDVNRVMLYALGASHTFSYHGMTRGSFRANLISGYGSSPSVAGLPRWDVLMPNVKVDIGAQGTDKRNPYKCGIFDLSQLLVGKDMSQKHHVVQFEAKLNPESAQYVHHMILYACKSDLAEMQGFTHNMVITDCESMPRGCYSMKWPWAVGGKPLTFPADVGMPFGQGQKWIALQMHYYNPSLDQNVVDSSGVTLTLAQTTRSMDAGVFEMNGGTSDDMRDPMPQGQKDVELEFFIPRQCSEQWKVPYINVIGTAYHAHLLGTRLNIDVIRDGAYVAPLRRQNRYDFMHQSLEEGPIKKLYKGDEWKMTCQYDTRSRNSDVHFGDLTQTEMCWAAFLYYPLQTASAAHYGGKENPHMSCSGFWSKYSDIDKPKYTVPSCTVIGALNKSSSMSDDTGNATGSVSTTSVVSPTVNNSEASTSSTPTAATSCIRLSFAIFVSLATINLH